MKITTTYRVEGPKLTLHELRLLVDATSDLPADIPVQVVHSDNQRDGAFSSLTVTLSPNGRSM